MRRTAQCTGGWHSAQSLLRGGIEVDADEGVHGVVLPRPLLDAAFRLRGSLRAGCVAAIGVCVVLDRVERLPDGVAQRGGELVKYLENRLRLVAQRPIPSAYSMRPEFAQRLSQLAGGVRAHRHWYGHVEIILHGDVFFGDGRRIVQSKIMAERYELCRLNFAINTARS